MSDELRRLRDATRARRDAVARVKAGTARELTPEDLKALLRAVPSAPEGAAARIKANVADLRPRPARPWIRVGAAALFGAGLLGAAALSLGARLRADAPVALDLVDGQRVVVGELTLDADGHGALSGTRSEPRLRWQEGRARIAAADLLVETREAEVRLADGALAVTRDVAGTTVDAERGTLDVRCLVDGAVHTLAPGAAFTCPPVIAEGMLARARHEYASGADLAAVVATVDEGLTRPLGIGGETARTELLVLRIQLLAESGRRRDALADTRALLAADARHRRPEIERLAAALALTEEGCAGALPHLDAVAATDLDAALRLAACAPDRAAQVLDAAAPLARSPEDHQALTHARSLLGVD